MQRHSEFPIPGLMGPPDIPSASPEVIFLPPHRRCGDWVGVASLGPYLIDQVAPEAPVEEVWVVMHHLAEGKHPMWFGSTEASPYQIDIADPATWEFSIPRQKVLFRYGQYRGFVMARDTLDICHAIYDLRLRVVD